MRARFPRGAHPAPPPSRAAAALLLALAACTASERRGGEADRHFEGPTDEAAERLKALPYAAWAPIAPAHEGKRGVVRHDPGRAIPGLNLYASQARGEAWLLDMAGRVRHRWSSSEGQPPPGAPVPSFFRGWQHVHATPEGGLLAIVGRHRVLKLDARSHLVWSVALAAHHEIAPAPDGGVVTLVEAPRIVVVGGRRRLVLDDEVVRLGPGGDERSRVSLWDVLSADARTASRLEQTVGTRYAAFDRVGVRALLQAPAGAARPTDAPDLEAVAAWLGEPRLPPDASRETLARLRALPASPPDVVHANSVQLVSERVEGVAQPGDLLVASRELDLVAVVDPEAGRLRWSWGPGILERPHQPTLLPSGRLLVFDNGSRRRRSRILELDAATQRITWAYGEAPEEAFFSETMGGCQPLPGGNVLVTDSEAGRAFEVTRDRRVVWEFFNPALGGSGRGTIYRMQRLSGGAVEALAARLALGNDPS